MEEFLISSNGDQMSIYEETYRSFLSDRCIIFCGEIGDGVIDDAIMYILKWNKEDKDLPIEKRKKIRLYISSVGGSTFSANMLIDVIAQSKTPVIGVALDLVASAAYLCYLACHERYAFENSSFLQHEGDLSIGNSRSKFKQTAEFFDMMENRSKEFILSRTKMTSEFYDSVYEQEYWLYADKAQELGIVDKIVGKDCSIDEIL